MTSFKNPQQYVNQAEIIMHAGKYIQAFAKKLVLVFSPTAIRQIPREFYRSLEDAGIIYENYEYEGYPTKTAIQALMSFAEIQGADALLVIGGGRMMDLGKAAASLAEIPVITIPSIAATNAAWRSNSILYDETGRHVGKQVNDQGPRLVLVDPKVILKAPARYIGAGIVDALAKWYECQLYVKLYPNDFKIRVEAEVSKTAFEFLSTYGYTVYQQGASSDLQVASQVLDALFGAVGFSGSYAGGKLTSGFAHPFHNVVTRIRSTNQALHGEVVAFGLICQFILEKLPNREIQNRMALFQRFGVKADLAFLGIENEEKLHKISQDLEHFFDQKEVYFKNLKASEILHAIETANDLLLAHCMD